MKRLTLPATVVLSSTLLLATTACQDDTEVSDVEGAVLNTSEGDITVELFPEDAPLAVANFVDLAEGEGVPNPVTGDAAFYDGTVFHRVIEGFMVQGGDPEGTGRGGPGYTFEDEFDSGRTFDEPGVLAMANSGPDTNGSQFFITVAPTTHLNGGHTIFGQVADDESYAVVEAISQVRTDQNDRPVEDVVLESVTIQRAGD
ncbi:peptidylprolyl isomerase [Nocardiopsis sp. EMB25]|uniref:peptidylprolyl isomerase n=1 Tax=Nocardiopsis sp. EMB25 TaxID=2835867 RepID=UPI0022836E84|nr:peptidylprolyl isomerase [Nocardiopsis sp. EMB25]MCY9785600.1 peptidylprolyl isomerase [Nocardiopsis sp. EMB25]